jgi:tetraacyldisaccharide 4'-kinase
VSRGYAGHGGPNDEALVLAENLPHVPHWQGPNRVAVAREALSKCQADVLILDDGFQHRRLARDLDILLIDATEPWGNGHLFPRGLLREERQGLARAGIILFTRSDQVSPSARGRLREAVAHFAPDAPVMETNHRPQELVSANQHVIHLDELARRRVAAFCGIGNPKAFVRTLVDLGANVVALRFYPDHHRYSDADIQSLASWARQLAKDCVVVTTQKDLVKLRLLRIGDRPLWALRVCLDPQPHQAMLDHKLKEVFQ